MADHDHVATTAIVAGHHDCAGLRRNNICSIITAYIKSLMICTCSRCRSISVTKFIRDNTSGRYRPHEFALIFGGVVYLSIFRIRTRTICICLAHLLSGYLRDTSLGFLTGHSELVHQRLLGFYITIISGDLFLLLIYNGLQFSLVTLQIRLDRLHLSEVRFKLRLIICYICLGLDQLCKLPLIVFRYLVYIL